MAQRFVPVAGPETETFWRMTAQGELWLPRCDHCGRPFFYPRPFCPHCSSERVSWFRSSGLGVVESFLINHSAAPGYEDDVPYVIALIMLDDGVRLTSNLLDIEQSPQAVHVGLPVEVTYEKRGDMTLPQFRPRRAPDET